MTTEPSRFRGDIQGLRAVAVSAVVLYHAGVPFVAGGYVGVDVFFVISGFLITSHLISGLRRDGRISFADFYARRARRILPASFVVLTVSVIAAVVWYPPLLMREVWAGAVSTAFYVPNIVFAVQGTDYLAETTPSLFQHYWSLGIEEQFYLLWPLVLVIGYRFARRTRWLFAVVLVLVVLSLSACLLLTLRSQPWAFFSLPTRAWELGVGGLVAFLLSYRPGIVADPARSVVGWAGLGGILASVLFFSESTPFPGPWAILPVLSTAAVIVAGGGHWGPTRMLSTRPMLFVGLISYSLYLVHWPLLMIPQAAVGFEHPLPLWATIALGLASVPVAWLLYRFVEEPGRRGSWLSRARARRTLVAAGAASVLAAAVATGSFAYSNSLPLHSDRSATPPDLSLLPQGTDFVPQNLKPALRDASGDQPVIYRDGCHLDFAADTPAECVFGDGNARRIVLFGDSHAAQWFPALLRVANEHGYALETHTKSSCPSISAEIERDGSRYEQCQRWRDAVIDRINSQHPALVVLANYGVAKFHTPEADYGDQWAAALAKTMTEIDAPKVVLADSPDLRTTPSVCLSANLESANRCAVDRALALSRPARAAEKRAAATADVLYVDLTDRLCGREVCAPILGDALVYRDAHHITATFSALLASPLGDALGPLLDDPGSP
ncbi:acyltransferase family protein [Microbacterium sp.]|uniref:acyltransferase family protein n=1 Tax=Microbacterium sp. TaxID=51671 RepID=UPI0039E5C818